MFLGWRELIALTSFSMSCRVCFRKSLCFLLLISCTEIVVAVTDSDKVSVSAKLIAAADFGGPSGESGGRFGTGDVGTMPGVSESVLFISRSSFFFAFLAWLGLRLRLRLGLGLGLGLGLEFG